ncbi:helix-turn-helix transcriptional regulator [Microvirga arsenatis]|uniref:Helix-turn-helix domain-containing protein n=1 Tax=Microvirga arsenatis TaxID=2692265 RepID=A0ABW9YTY4_9HYPH|nr:AraC family transcriptional regulator [Microvirga arsenatis]NBJ09314.1 helix-turn-helix domain-containing protein [Microvirga arsenatis]NBJ23828.1 helix-turn-helix domain-containing protein [Microvirga arsenatis]
MRIVGRGRIVMWEGGSLWTFDVPPAPEGRPSTRLHAHHAIQITLSAGGRFRIRTEGGCMDGPVVLIAPDVPHAFEPEGKIALLFVDPESRAGRALTQGLEGAPVARLDTRLGHAPSRLADLWADVRPDDRMVEALGQALVQDAIGGAVPARTLDPRIARTLTWLRSRIGEGVGLAEAAAIACLSDSRFSHLFAAEVGLPFRSYLLWRRLMLAVERISAGSSITEAAHEAGFADSAHFSRTFRRMFGVPAAALQLI